MNSVTKASVNLSLVFLLALGTNACSPGQSLPSVSPSPASAPALVRSCVSSFLSASQIADSLAEVRIKIEDSSSGLPEDARISLQASALTQAIQARIGLDRTQKFIDSGLGVAWQLQVIQSRFAFNPADLCQSIDQSL